MEPWYRQLGFYHNPFSIKPLSYHNEIYGYDLDSIQKKIAEGNVLFLEGEYGRGKTSILKKIINQFGGRRNLIYYSCNRLEGQLDLDQLLKGAGSFLRRLIGNNSKDAIFLLDEVQDLSVEDGERIARLYNDKQIKSIILVSHDYQDVKFGKELSALIEGNVIRLNEISDQEAIRIVRGRIGNIRLLSEATITDIFDISQRNPRQLLKNCEKVCRYAVEQGARIVGAEHVRKVLGAVPNKLEKPEIKIIQ